MGEVTTPGCFAGSIGPASATGRGTLAAGPRRDGPAASACICRATRTRCPSRSNSISLSPVSSSRRASSRTRSGSIASLSLLLRSPLMSLALAPRPDQRGQAVDGERVTADPEAAQAGFGDRGYVGMMAKALARENVADVDFDHGHLDRRNRIANCDRGVSIAARIDDDAGGVISGSLMDQVHDFTLVVRLPKLELEFVASGGFTAKPLYISQRRAAIGLGLACAEQIEIGAVEDVDSFRHGRFAAGTRTCRLYGPPTRRGSRCANRIRRLTPASTASASVSSWSHEVRGEAADSNRLVGRGGGRPLSR